MRNVRLWLWVPPVLLAPIAILVLMSGTVAVGQNAVGAPGIVPASSPAPTYDYVIITTAAIESSSAQLAGFVTVKQNHGYHPLVVDEGSWGGGVGDTAAENIRAWLKSHYVSYGIKYVLLIGNPDAATGDVPMKMCWPRKGAGDGAEKAATDYYYADLTGNWDLNGDDYYGDYTYDRGTGGIDLVPEAYVGRIPCYGSITDLDAILQKLVAYETTTGDLSSRRTGLIAAGILDYANEDHSGCSRTDNSSWGEACKTDIFVAAGAAYHRMYEKAGRSPVTTGCESNLTHDNLIAQWNSGYGLIALNAVSNGTLYRKVWVTDDGDNVPESEEISYPALLNSSDCSQLPAGSTSVVAANGDSLGDPSNPNNLQYSLLLRGAVGVVAASGASWYSGGNWGPGGIYAQGYPYNVLKKMQLENKSIAQSDFEFRQLAEDVYTYMNACDYNVLGDPSMKLIENPGVDTNSLPAGWVGVAYGQTPAASGGVPPYTWSLFAGNLPAGLSLDSTDGTICGTPSVGGSSTFALRISDSQSPAATGTKSLSITVIADLAVATSSLPNCLTGAAYSQALSATGGVGPYAWTLVGGSLPAGMSLDPAGVISGTASSSGCANFTVQVSDSQSPADSATKALSITVSDVLLITTTSLANGRTGNVYSQTISAAGGAVPYAWSVANGTLPAGLSLNCSSGVISGTPTSAGTWNFTVSVSDNAAASATQALSITVYVDLAITTACLPGGQPGVEYSQTLAATGGVTPYNWSLDSGALPGGLWLDADTGIISGTPVAVGMYCFTVRVTDSQFPADAAVKALSMGVAPPGPTYQFAASDSESSTSNTNFVIKTALTFTPPAADDWIVFGFAEFKCSNASYATYVQLFIDGTGEGQNTRKPVDATDYMPFITVKVKNLSAGQHTLQLSYRAANSGYPAYIRNARICAVRKAALEFYNVAYDNAMPLTVNLQDIVTLSWTPPATGNYLVISTGEINATTAVSTDLQTIYNGTLNDEGIMRAADNGDYTTFMSFNYLTSAPAGVQISHKIAGKKLASDPINHYIRRARILALRLSNGRFNSTAAGYGIQQCTTQTTFQQALSTTWAYGVSGNWLLLNSCRLNNTSTNCQTEVRVQLNDTYICGQQLMKMKDLTDLLNYSSIDVRSLTTPRQVDMDWRTTDSSGTAIVKRLRFYGLPLDAQ